MTTTCPECGFQNVQSDICSACNADLHPQQAVAATSAERAIVERLAAMQEPLCETGYGDTDCALCGAHRPYDPHDADCPWQAARNLVKP
ncbi:hypothetical protein AB7M69_006543 [Bradyrhizobium japonicum]